MECFICCENKNPEEFLKCENQECNYEACIECNKKYLLDSMQDVHCMSCRNVIPYETFLTKFGKKWIFGKYKTHKEHILINIEKSRFKDDMQQIFIENKKKELNEEINAIYQEYRKNIRPIQEKLREITIPNKKRESYISHFQCSDPECNGFLDKDFLCQLCNTQTCKKCYVPLEEGESVKIHACDEEQIATFAEIKEHSKTCPSCGEFISKINGCDQMFCVKCGTSFSWKTGNIEKGVVHNPHAHAFFQNNPQMAENYRKNINGNQGNGCRTHIPHFILITEKVDQDTRRYLQMLHRTVTEFRAYYRVTYSNKIENDIDGKTNETDRKKLLKKDITEERFKSLIHMRYKKHNYSKQIATLIRSTFDIMELFFWELADSSINEEDENNNNLVKLRNNNQLIYDSMMLLINDTNKNIKNITELFGYSKVIHLSNSMRGMPYSL